MKTNINTNSYQFSHGKKPSGYGFWFFEVDGETFSFTGKYSDLAKKLRKQYGPNVEIKVLP